MECKEGKSERTIVSPKAVVINCVAASVLNASTSVHLSGYETVAYDDGLLLELIKGMLVGIRKSLLRVDFSAVKKLFERHRKVGSCYVRARKG